MNTLYINITNAVEIARRFICDRYVQLSVDDVRNLHDRLAEKGVNSKLLSIKSWYCGDDLYIKLNDAAEIARRFACDNYIVFDDEDTHDLRDEMQEECVSAKLEQTQIPE